MTWADESDIRKVLADCETWAVVGLSSNTQRAAYGVARFLQRAGRSGHLLTGERR